MTRQYAAFISYRHCPLDIAVAEKIHRSVERFRIPRDLRRAEQKTPGSVFTNWEGQPLEGNLVVFRDREELLLSNDLTAAIYEALDNSRCLIVVCTPDTPKSPWVRREISYFIKKHGRDRVITVLAAGTPEESIPREITTVYAEDGVTVLEEYEPLVAYLTADSRRKILKNLDKERIRLCAAILGCPYDALRQRHRRRKTRQTAAAITAAFMIALGFIGMLINRNLEIEAQKRSVQLRESELLAADAKEALLKGDALRAIQSAVSALPKEGEQDRPYYAPAESALMEAMDIFSGTDARERIKEMTLEQMTPISHFCLSADGALAVTLDDYGVLHCFDTVSGQELWTDIQESPSAGRIGNFVMISQDNQFLICSHSGQMECRSPVTGDVFWSCPQEYSDKNGFFYDHTGNRIALINLCFREAQAALCLELTLLDAKTGNTISRIVLDQPETYSSYSFSDNGSSPLPQNGVFSEDGRYFACALTHNESGKSAAGVACFVVDLENMCVVTDCRQDLPDSETYCIIGMDLQEDHIFLALESTNVEIAATVLKLDKSTGELLWCTATAPEPANSATSPKQSSCVLFWDTIAIVGRYKQLSSIDLDTGAVLHNVELPGMLRHLYTVSPKDFAFSLTDGTYAVGWHESSDFMASLIGYNTGGLFHLSTDSWCNLSVDIGSCSLLMPYKGGIIQRYTDGGDFQLSVSNAVQEGYLALVSGDQENQLILKRPITLEKKAEETIISLPAQQKGISCSETNPAFCTNNILILGPFSATLEDYSQQVFYASIDRRSHQIVEIIPMDTDFSQRVFFLPDGTGYLRYAEGTTWLHKNGTAVPIAQQENPDDPDNSYYSSALIHTDTVRLTDGNLLTAHCDSSTLTLLINGAEKAVLPLPQEQCFDPAPSESLIRQVIAGRNGSILIGFHRHGEDIPSDALALCGSETGWAGFSEAFSLSNTRAVAFANRENLLALVNDQHQVCLFRQETGDQITSFPLQLPSRSVMYMDFILEDRYLLVKTDDAQILIYDLSSGQICFHDKLNTRRDGIARTYVDDGNQRLYIIDSTGACLCIDLRSWTTLGSGSSILCYDEDSGELIHFDRQGFLSCIRIPSTGELVLQGQQLLAAHEPDIPKEH